jgi:two-component system, cell cycle sensor histidine kinase and response regulator CckA
VAEPRLRVVLVVDDEPAIRELAATVLQLRGYLTLSACDAGEALKLSRHHQERIDVLITDVELGDGDGIELAGAIRAERPDVAVLVVSGNGTYKSRAVSNRCGFLAKPFRATQLLESVQRLLARK